MGDIGEIWGRCRGDMGEIKEEVRPAAHHDVEAAHGVGVASERDRRAAVWVPQPDRAWLGLGVGVGRRLGVGVGVGMPTGSVPG